MMKSYPILKRSYRMLQEKQIKSLKGYLGFTKRKRSIYVGLKMEEMLARKKACYLFLLPSCSEKKEEELSHYQDNNPDLVIYRYQGKAVDLKEMLGYELLNAFCVSDVHLAKAILDVLKADID